MSLSVQYTNTYDSKFDHVFLTLKNNTHLIRPILFVCIIGNYGHMAFYGNLYASNIYRDTSVQRRCTYKMESPLRA